jgi:phosphatidyl-myo-inositol alpha-mannosyltransferase
VKRHALRVAAEMRRLGDEVTVIGPLRRGAAGSHARGFGGVVNIPANGGANNIAILTPPSQVRRFFRSRAFDIVHVHEPLVPLLPYYSLWFSPGAAHICTFHMYSEREPLGSQVARRLLGRLTFPSYQRGIAVSRPAGAYAGLAWKKDLTLIPNGVSTRKFARSVRPVRSPTEDDPLRLLFVGRWEDRRKGLTCLLAAFARLRARGVPVTLHVVGAGPRGHLPAPPGVTLHGVVRSTAALVEHYRNCDVFISPALGQESFGMVVLEAMSCGRPVICSDIAGYRQLADPGGAQLVPPGDADALAQAIAALAADPARRRGMGELNRARAEGYDWRGVAERVRAEYVEAIGERHGAEVARAHGAAAQGPRWNESAAEATLRSR